MGDFSALPGTAIVVGGTGGIGAEIVRMLADRGSRVCFTYHGNASKAAELSGDDVKAAQLDITDAAAVNRVVDAFAADGGVHTVVHAAGAHVPMRHLSTVEAPQFHEQLNTDTAGFFNVAAAALPHLRASHGNLSLIHI